MSCESATPRPTSLDALRHALPVVDPTGTFSEPHYFPSDGNLHRAFSLGPRSHHPRRHAPPHPPLQVLLTVPPLIRNPRHLRAARPGSGKEGVQRGSHTRFSMSSSSQQPVKPDASRSVAADTKCTIVLEPDDSRKAFFVAICLTVCITGDDGAAEHMRVRVHVSLCLLVVPCQLSTDLFSDSRAFDATHLQCTTHACFASAPLRSAPSNAFNARCTTVARLQERRLSEIP